MRPITYDPRANRLPTYPKRHFETAADYGSAAIGLRNGLLLAIPCWAVLGLVAWEMFK